MVVKKSFNEYAFSNFEESIRNPTEKECAGTKKKQEGRPQSGIKRLEWNAIHNIAALGLPKYNLA